jgi:DNA-binding SARP family transcriptional activator
LYSYLARLRRALADSDDVTIQRRPGGYVLTADPSAVDLHRFRRLVEQATTARDEEAVALYTQALERRSGSRVRRGVVN